MRGYQGTLDGMIVEGTHVNGEDCDILSEEDLRRRVYASWTDMEAVLRERKLPLRTLAYCKKRGAVEMWHSSGHAQREDVGRLIRAAGAETKIIPMHTDSFEGFRRLCGDNLLEMHKN